MKWKITETHDIDELELDRCSQTLGLAFENYALMHHFIDPENRARRISEYQDTFLRKVGMRAGHVWSADGGVAVASGLLLIWLIRPQCSARLPKSSHI